jgi:hypothetical protein
MKKDPAKPAPGPVVPPGADPVAPAPGAESARGEVAGCPTGLSPDLPVVVPGQPADAGADPATAYSPAEAVNEEQKERSGVKE